MPGKQLVVLTKERNLEGYLIVIDDSHSEKDKNNQDDLSDLLTYFRDET